MTTGFDNDPTYNVVRKYLQPSITTANVPTSTYTPTTTYVNREIREAPVLSGNNHFEVKRTILNPNPTSTFVN